MLSRSSPPGHSGAVIDYVRSLLGDVCPDIIPHHTVVCKAPVAFHGSSSCKSIDYGSNCFPLFLSSAFILLVFYFFLIVFVSDSFYIFQILFYLGILLILFVILNISQGKL